MNSSTNTSQWITTFIGIAILSILAFVAPEKSAAFVVAVVCGAIGVLGTSLLRDPRERTIVRRWFIAAFLLRLLFTVALYETNAITVLGGADDMGWEVSWRQSRLWIAQQQDPSVVTTALQDRNQPNSILAVYDGTAARNRGFKYWMTYFYYVLGFRSQMAFAFFNCFLSAVTVVFIYKSSRLFFSEQASSFSAGIATILPGFLAWSALTIKETSVILFSVVAFFAIWRWRRSGNLLYALLALAMMGMVLSFRFYVAWVLLATIPLIWVTARSQRPWRSAFLSLAGLALLVALLVTTRFIHFDMGDILVSRLDEMEDFRSAVSGEGGGRRALSGTGSAVQLDYDIHTPAGAAKMILIGSAYLLFSPFPWQFTNVRQAMALPDVLLWWGLVVMFIVPGISYMRRQHAAALLSIGAIVLPLILFYSMIFGNVGLAYRQRAQLMSFLLIIAAAGYDQRRLRARHASWQEILKTQSPPELSPYLTKSSRTFSKRGA